MKTLRDLELWDGFLSVRVSWVRAKKEETNAHVNVFELRKAAIEWIKELRKQDAWKDEKLSKFQDGEWGFRGIQLWITEFFNITEEDLK